METKHPKINQQSKKKKVSKSTIKMKMDLDLEIISEESDCPDPLFDSIMNAMNSMKEATADKIYQKIQKEGETNYSKPQVGRALASALKYGIFEMRNNRYRVRDDILDDEDTVYWKLHNKREQTPFRIQDDINDRQAGPKLDPERDNQRFKMIRSKGGSHQCPHCGRIKKPGRENQKRAKKSAPSKNSKKKKKGSARRRLKAQYRAAKRILKKKKYNKRIKELLSEEQCANKKKTHGKQGNEKSTEKDEPREDETRVRDEDLDSSDSDYDLVSPASNEQSFKSYSDESRNKHPIKNNKSRSLFSLECVDADDDKAKRSNSTLKFDSESDQMDVSSFSFDESRREDSFFESLPCTSRNASGKSGNQFFNSTETYRNKYGRNQTEQCQEKSDWLGCSDEPQGTIILSNNVLTIEPMDSLAFKSPEQATYIS